MSTTELVVEQVLTGLLALAVLLIPWWPELYPILINLKEIGSVLTSAVGFGAVYFLGVVIDRLADTLTEELNCHHRLRYGLGLIEEYPRSKGEWQDPFPEDKLLMTAMSAGESYMEWINYLRARVRLTRSLVALSPALTFSVVLLCSRLPMPSSESRSSETRCCCSGLAQDQCAGQPNGKLTTGINWKEIASPSKAKNNFAVGKGWNPRLLIGVAIIYWFALWQITARSRNQSKDAWKKWQSVPRTDAKAAWDYAEALGYHWQTKKNNLRKPSIWPVLCTEIFVRWAVLIHVAAIGLSVPAMLIGKFDLFFVAMAGILLTALAGWSWWRIRTTYRAYLRQVNMAIAYKKQ